MTTSSWPVRRPRVLVWGNDVPDGLGHRITTVLDAADVEVRARPDLFAHQAVRRYESDVRARSPDLLVLAYGALERSSWRDRWARVATARRPDGRRLGRWRGAVALFLTALAGLAQASRPGSTRRYERALRHLLRLARLDLGAHVVVVAPTGPGADPYATASRRVAGEHDDGVTVVPGDAPDLATAIAAAAPSGPAISSTSDDAAALSMVVLGNSVAVLMVPPRSERAEGTYGEVAADHLTAAGVPTRVALEGRWFDFAVRARRQYDERVARHRPDVVVLHFGTNEAQPWLVPIPLLRHLLATDRATTPAAEWYRRVPAARVWGWVRAYRRRVSPLVGQRTWQTTPRRFATAMDGLVRRIRDEFDALVLVVDLTPPGGTLAHFLPGQPGRHERFRAELAGVVSRADDPAVRLVPTSDLVADLGVDQALRDGIHLSPEAHRRLAERIVAEVRDWQERRRAT